MMKFDEFISKYSGKATDYDGAYGAQCVDLIKMYLSKCFGIVPGTWGNAHAYYDNFNAVSALKNNFIRIANTPDFVPQKGDIAVWGKSLNGNYGHIAICTGEGDKSHFYSYDQNWTGRHDPCTKVRHNYSHFLGVLRPKSSQTEKKGVSKGDKLTLSKQPLYAASTAKTAVKSVSGAYYVYDGAVINNRIRITTKAEYCGKVPAGTYVTGWIDKP